MQNAHFPMRYNATMSKPADLREADSQEPVLTQEETALVDLAVKEMADGQYFTPDQVKEILKEKRAEWVRKKQKSA